MSLEAIKAWRRRWGEGPFLTVDLVVFTLRPSELGPVLSVLLVERGVAPFEGELALPGGFVEPHEGLGEAALRELAAETSVNELGDVVIEQLATFGDPDRDPRARVVRVAHTALVPLEVVRHAHGGDDARATVLRAIRPGDVHATDERGRRVRLAFDHDDILRVAIERLRGRVTYTTAPFALMPETFTLAELQAAYEAILGASLHRRAFRERVEREGWVEPTGEVRGGAHRPARVFRAATRELLWMRPWPEAAKTPGGLKARADD
jgi:8-oxo-dGTP diphosphatase